MSLQINISTKSFHISLSTRNLPNVDLLAEEVRRIYLKNINSSLGVMISGGNAVGIFVSDILPDSVAKHNGLRVGDQILEVSDIYIF